MNGCTVLRYIGLPDGCYFGGTTNDAYRELDFGPHIRHTAQSLMALFARLAHAKVPYPYIVVAMDKPQMLHLKPDGLRADDIAAVLGITPNEVTAYYGLAIRLQEQSPEDAFESEWARQDA